MKKMKINVVESGLLENFGGGEITSFEIEKEIMKSICGGADGCVAQACGIDICLINFGVIDPVKPPKTN